MGIEISGYDISRMCFRTLPYYPFSVDYLIIGGGGAGGGTAGGGGGGAGGFRTGNLSVDSNVFAITVGAGGTGTSTVGSNGSSSCLLTIIAYGGGYGGYRGSPDVPAAPGASGGGAFGSSIPASFGGAGNVPPTSPVQGYCGGRNYSAGGGYGSGGGG